LLFLRSWAVYSAVGQFTKIASNWACVEAGAILKLHHMEQAFGELAGVISVRAGWFMENYAGLVPHVRSTGVLSSMLAPLDRAHPMVATQDIGQVVADRDLCQPRHDGDRAAC
jgi:hypothetical protein